MLLLILYGYAILPLTYLLSFIWTLPATGYSSAMSLNLFLGVFPLFAIMFAHSLSSNAKALTDKLNFIFLIYPLYNLCSAIKNIYTSFSVQEMCKNTVELCVKNIPSYDWAQCQDFACNYTPDCCGKYKQLLFYYLFKIQNETSHTTVSEFHVQNLTGDAVNKNILYM